MTSFLERSIPVAVKNTVSEQWKDSKFFAFLQSLHFAIVTSLYWNVILKPSRNFGSVNRDLD